MGTMQHNMASMASVQIAWEGDAGRKEPAHIVADKTLHAAAAALATFVSPDESELQSKVCELEQRLHEVEARRMRDLQALREALHHREEELAAVVACQAMSRQQDDDLKQAQQHIVQLQHELECSSVKDEEEHQKLQEQLSKMETAVAEREQQIGSLQQRHAEVATAVEQLSQETNAAQQALIQALQAEGGQSQPGSLCDMGAKPLPDLAATVADAHATLQARYLEEAAQRRALHNELVDLKGAIRVFCRVRPLLAKERAAGLQAATSCNLLTNTITVTGNRVGRGGAVAAKARSNSYSYDAVYEAGSSQGCVFADVEPVVTSVMDGYNVCIFAYGQTGSGKTYTMEGPPEDRGVNYRTLGQLFRSVEARRHHTTFNISVSLLEVYMDSIGDLLWDEQQQGPRPKLEVRIGAFGSHLPGLTEKQVHSVEEAWQVLQVGAQSRHSAQTKMNERSSRSHCMLCVKVRGQSKLTGDVWRSKLWLVDLAGSERVGKTEAQGERLREAQFINKSLSALGDCIHALSTRSSHVPFRNSKLTYVLQDSLSGDSKTLMLVNVNPTEEDAGETACSLGFAARVRGVELGPAKRHIEAGAEVQELRCQLEALRQQMQAVENDRRRLADKLSASEAAGYSFMSGKLAQLEAEVATQQTQLQQERARAARLEIRGGEAAVSSSHAGSGVAACPQKAMPPPPPGKHPPGFPKGVSRASAGTGFGLRVPLQANVVLDGEDSMASVESHRDGLSSSRAPALLQTAVRYRAGAGPGAGAGALCSTPPSANKRGGWSMSSTGRGSPGPTPKLRAAEPSSAFRGAQARAVPSSAFKRCSQPPATTPLKTASLRTGMAAFSGLPGVTTGTSRSLQTCVSATSSQAGSKATAASNPNSFAKLTERPGAGDMTSSHAPAVSSSASTSIAQQVVGSETQLADQPILGPAAVQPWDKQTSDDRASQADAASAVDLGAAAHRGSCHASVARSAHATKTLIGDSHWRNDSEVENVAEVDGAASAFSRAASPPLFEAEVGEDSLVDFGDTEGSNDACDVTMVSQHQESTASSLIEADAQRQDAVSNQRQGATAVGSKFGAQVSAQQQQQLQLSVSCTAASGFQIQSNALRGSQAVSLSSTEQAGTVAHAAAAAAMPLRPVLQPASGKLLNAQRVVGPGDAAAPSSQLVKDTASAREARAAVPSVARHNGSKENEEVGMARVVRRVGNAHSWLDRQTVVQPTKPTTSSKAEYMARFEQYRKARAEARPASALGTGQQATCLTMGAGRVKSSVKLMSVNLRPARTPLRNSSVQK